MEILNTGFGKAAVMAYVSAAFIMFAASILGKLSYFKYLLALIMVFLGVLALKSIHKDKRSFKDLLKAFTPSFVVFTVFFFYLYVTMKTKGLSQVDDNFRWAAKVQEALRLDCLYTSTAYSFVKPDYYPPFTTLNEIFFNKMLGDYSDSSSLLANGSLCFTLLLPFLDRLNWKKEDILKIICASLVTVMILLSVNHNPTMNGSVFIFNTTYPDWITGLMIACAFLEILCFENSLSSYLFFAFLNSALLQTDRICFAFSLLITVTLFFRLLVKKELDKKSLGRFFIFAVFIPVALYFGWRVYLSVFAPKLLFHIALPRDNVLKVSDPQILSSGISLPALQLADYQHDILTGFIGCLFREPIYVHPFKIAYLPFNILVLAVLLALNIINRKDKQLCVVGIFYFLGSLAYAFVVCYTYMFNYPYEEAITLAVYGRYMQSYTISGLAVMLYALLIYIKHWAVYIAVLLISVGFVEPLSIDSLVPTPDRKYYHQDERILIKDYVDHQYDGEPTIVVDVNDVSYYYLIRNLYGEKAANLKLFHDLKKKSYEDFVKLCEENDYILIGDYDSAFVEKYWYRLSDTPCYNSALYRIVHADHGVDFELVYGFEAMGSRQN